MKVCVIGLGKLGSPLAAVLASKGHTVIGVDRNDYFVDSINAGRAPVVEPAAAGAHRRLKGTAARATHSYEEAIPQTDISFVILPTPSEHTGAFTNAWVLDAVKENRPCPQGVRPLPRRQHHLDGNAGLDGRNDSCGAGRGF